MTDLDAQITGLFLFAQVAWSIACFSIGMLITEWRHQRKR